MLVKDRLLLLKVEVRVGHIELVLLGEGAEICATVTQARRPRKEPYVIFPLLMGWLLNG